MPEPLLTGDAAVGSERVQSQSVRGRYYHSISALQTKTDALIELIRSVRSEVFRVTQNLTTNEGDAALEVCDHNFGTAIYHIANILPSIAEAPDVFIPELPQRNLSVRVSSFKVKG